MIKIFKEFLEESIKEIKEKDNNITIKKEEENKTDEYLAMYYSGVFDDLFK